MKKYLSSFHKTDEKILDEYVSNWTLCEIPKKSIFTEPGSTERYLYFVKEGIQKSYYLNDGKQHVMFFAYPSSFSGVVESFFTQTPSKYYLETITDSTFLRISFSRHARLISKYGELETLFRKITESFLLGIIERHHELMAFDLETRFRIFVKRSPHLLNMVSHKDISSYLRMDPTNFSKLINSISI